jgi:hypothetical protein
MYGLARWWVVARIVECLRVCRAWTLNTWTGSQLHSRQQQSVLQHVRVLLPRFSERKQILLVVCLTEIRGEGRARVVCLPFPFPRIAPQTPTPCVCGTSHPGTGPIKRARLFWQSSSKRSVAQADAKAMGREPKVGRARIGFGITHCVWVVSHSAREPPLPVPNATASYSRSSSSPSPCGTYGQTKRNANAEESFLQPCCRARLQCMRSIGGLAAHAWGALGGCCCGGGGSLQGISGTRTPPAHLPAVFGVVGSSALRHRRRAPQSTRAHGCMPV